MPDGLPTFSDATDAAKNKVRQTGRQLIPWLSDPLTCEECGSLMYASETFDPREAMYVKSWECRECDAPDRYRDPEYGGKFAHGPSEGSSLIRDVFER